jgi:two-component sensor histidine kinase
MDVETMLSPVPESARAARRFVRDQLIDLGFPKGIDDACLIVDELATNAIAAAPSTPFWVAVAVRHGWPVLMVQDCSSKLPEVQATDVTSEHGRGLQIVEALAVKWDAILVTGGKIVWVLLERG